MNDAEKHESGFNKELCNERHIDIKEHFSKTDQRLDVLEGCTIKLTQMIEKYDSQLDDHTRRITAIERKPIKLIDTVIGYAVSALFGALAAGTFTYFIE